MKKITHLNPRRLALAFILPALALMVAVTAVAQSNEKENVKVKIVRIVDGDTSIIEKTLNEAGVSDFTKQFEDVKGKNVQMAIDVQALNKDGKEKGKQAKSMNFNFNMDSSMANAFSRCMKLCDSMKCNKFVWNESMLKDFPGDFDFKFDFDDEGFKDDLNFKIDVDTDKDGKTVIVRSGNGKTVVIKGGEGDETVTETEDGETKTQTKTIVIDDEKSNKKKKVIVTTSVTVMDMDEKGASTKSERRRAKEESNMNFYPNPSDGNFTLELDLEGKEPATVRITDVGGKEVYNEKITGNGKVSKSINLNGKKGTFIVNIRQGAKNINKKIIIE